MLVVCGNGTSMEISCVLSLAYRFTRKWRIGIVDSADGLRHGGFLHRCGMLPCVSHFVQAISRKPAPYIGGRYGALVHDPIIAYGSLRRDNEKLYMYE